METIVHVDHPDLISDAAACWAVKDEVVAVEFAAEAGQLHSAVGVNRYEAGDALLTGSTGDRWCVSRARFDAKYRPEHATRLGEAGRYRNLPAPIRAKRMGAAFSVARSAGGDVLRGAAGDWLVQYAPGDHGIVARARFDAVYRIASDNA
jgi:PGDYG protein